MASADREAATVDSGTGEAPAPSEDAGGTKEQVHYLVAGHDGPPRRYEDAQGAAQAFAAADPAGRPFVVRVSRLGREAERSTHVAYTAVVRADGQERYEPSFAQQADPAFLAAYRAIREGAQPTRRASGRGAERKRARARKPALEALQAGTDDKSLREANEVDPESAAGHTRLAPTATFTLEGQSVTAIRYQAAVKDGRLTLAQLTFQNGKRRIGSFQGNRYEVRAILGERNLAQIESAGSERDSAVRGTLKGASLHEWHASLAEFERQAHAPTPPEPTSPENAIEREAELTASAAASISAMGDAAAMREALPAQIERRFIRVNARFYFPDNSLAFVDGGTRLKARTENIEVIRTLVQIAQVRGWTAIRVSGTPSFCARVWGEAARQGLAVRGYAPSPLEQAQLARETVEREARLAAKPDGHPPENVPAAGAAARVGQRSEAREGDVGRHGDLSSGTSSQPSVLFGKLLEAGEAPYRFDAQARPSAFLRIATDQGERVLWGIDFPRAMAQGETRPQFGDDVGVQYLGRRPVTVKVPVKGEDGAVAGHEDVATHRNTWLVEKPAFFAQREARAAAVRDPDLLRTQLAQSHPELAGALAWLHLAQQLAAERIADPSDQERFVSMVREGLAQAIARSQLLPPPKLRVVAPQRPPRGQGETLPEGVRPRAAANEERALAR